MLTVLLFRTIFAALPVGHEVLEAITALVAVAMLFYVSFWLIARLEHKRWLEFVRARMWSAVSVGSAASLVLVGFTAVYREGFETALFYQALMSFGTGLGIYILAGLVPRPRCPCGRRLADVPPRSPAADQDVHERRGRARDGHERRLPRQRRARAAGRRPRAVHPLAGWPRPPIFLSEATGYWPTVQTVTAQLVLTAVYVIGAIYVFVVKPRLARRAVGTSTHRADRRARLISR